MKKTLFVLISILIILLSMLFVVLKNTEEQGKEITKFNAYYESYLDKTFFGSEVATLIGKAIDNNEKYEISKNENNAYISDNKYSIKIYISIVGGKAPYEMETINNVGLTEFISNFNTVNFICTQINYHEETKRVSELYVEEIYE